MMEQVTARKSAGWRPTTTFASEMGMKESTDIVEIVAGPKLHQQV